MLLWYIYIYSRGVGRRIVDVHTFFSLNNLAQEQDPLSRCNVLSPPCAELS